MRSISAARQTIELAVCLTAFALGNRGQNARPDFTGIWRSVSTTRGGITNSVIEIKQSKSTLLLRAVLPDHSSLKWDVYSTNGKVMKTKTGRQLIETSGHWDESQLLLQDTGPGNAPWRRSAEQRTLSLSKDGRRMMMRIHYLGDKRSVHDYAIEWERVKQ